MVSTYAYPNFKLSNAVLLLAKLLLESESWGCVWKLPYLTPVGRCIKSRCKLDWNR